MRARFSILFLAAAMLFATGCKTYQLRGRVIEGSTSMILVVDKNDPRLTDQGFGLGGAAISATLDPHRLNRVHLPDTLSQWSGDFSLPVNETGAGLLEYEVQVDAVLAEHASVSSQFRLPGGSKRVLIVLAPGAGGTKQNNNDDILGETLEMGKPYLRGN